MSTIQEEILEMLARQCREIACFMESLEWDDLQENEKEMFRGDALQILKYLDENNVVIRQPNGANLEGCCLARLERLVEE